jgi:hypothetical protein
VGRLWRVIGAAVAALSRLSIHIVSGTVLDFI